MIGEAQRIDEALKRTLLEDLPVHPRVVGVQGELYRDSTGDDAVRIIVLIDDFTPEEDWTHEKMEPIAEAFRAAVRNSGIDRWPYIDFRTESEQREIDAERRQ